MAPMTRPLSPSLLLIGLLCACPVHAFRPLAEYQGALVNIMTSYLSPANQLQADAINSTLLAEDVVIRVDVTENYVGRELGTEYIWGLFANAERAWKNGTTQLIPFPISSTLASLVIQPPTVFASVIVNYSYPSFDYYIPLQLDQIIKFNDEDLTISSWDITFRRFPEAFYWVLKNTRMLQQIAKEDEVCLKPDTNVTQVLAHHAVDDICNVHEQYCIGADAQYSSKSQCMQDLMNKEFGQPWQGGQDTVLCRYLHKYMIPSRPSVHCPHISLSGGGMCAENDYPARVLLPPFKELLVGGL